MIIDPDKFYSWLVGEPTQMEPRQEATCKGYGGHIAIDVYFYYSSFVFYYYYTGIPSDFPKAANIAALFFFWAIATHLIFGITYFVKPPCLEESRGFYEVGIGLQLSDSDSCGKAGSIVPWPQEARLSCGMVRM